MLVADDDPGLRESLERTLTREGYKVVLASDGRAALERVQAGGVDLIVTDLRMPGLTGLELLRAAKAIMPDVDVILLTAFGTVEEAVKAMKDGAYDFLTKPFRREQLIKLVDKALERRDLIEQNRALKKQLEDIRAKGQMIGASPSFRRMLTLVEQIADSSATILIQGESGTGKELVARTIHERSGRRAGPFVAVNCAALPETLLESELFGYEKGAFTGAAGRKEGRFELANGGTLFLDEVADLSLVTQPKICVPQEGEFERLGATRSIQVDVHLGGHEPGPADMVKDSFREDLYYHSTSSRSARRRCASVTRTSACSPSTTCGSTPPRTAGSSKASRTRRSSGSNRTRGRATCASWRTSSSAWSCSRERTGSMPRIFPRRSRG